MLESFISFVNRVLNGIQPAWILLGALAVAALILLVGFIMTIARGRSLSNQKSCLHAVRGRGRRNLIFFLAFLFVIISTLAIFHLYYPAGGFVPYLAIPLLVLLWAFLCEAMFELMDNRNRKRAGLEVCSCLCSSDCTVDVEGIKERQSAKKNASEKPVAKKEEKEEKEVKEQKKAVSKEDAKREEITEHLKRAHERDREREELGAWREEIKSTSNSDEEELRRQRFEEERKHLSILARQAKAAQFGSESPSIYDKAAQRTISKPAPIAPTTASKPAPAPAPKQAEVVKKVEVEEKPAETTPTETVVERTTTRTASYQSVTKSEVTADAKFNSLQAKLDVLKKDTATAAAKTEKTDTAGKYKEVEVKSALDDLLKQMRAKRGEE